MVLRCCVPGCTNKGRFGFHKFPRDEGNCLKWQYKARKRNLNTQKLPFTQYRICEDHFKDDDYVRSVGKKRLSKFSVPSVLVPEEESVYEEHNYVNITSAEQENIVKEKYAPKSNKFSSLLSVHFPNQNGMEPEPYLEDVGPEINDSPSNENAKADIKKERILSYLHRQIRYQAKRIKILQQKLKNSNNFGKEKVIKYLSRHFGKDQMALFELQLRNIGKKNHGQRYTYEEKCMMLAIYKRGPRVYRYVAMLFGLPSRRTLCRHSALLKFETGINEKLFELLRSTASKLNPLDKMCTIGWDEMALTHHLSYCTSEDYIDGFVDFGDVRIPDFATHSLTFMIRGVNTQFKQPVAYFFTQNLKSLELAEIIKVVVRAVQDSGFKIIGSVCDQSNTMSAGVNRLINPHLDSMKQNGMLLSYHVDGNKIIHCFDPPHILKTIRNNLLTKNLKHFVTDFYDPDCELHEHDNDKEVFAAWEDIKDFHEFDAKNTCRLVPKITKDHIDPKDVIMKVSNASQVFSKSLGSIMLFCSKQNLVPRDYSGTAYLLMFVNNLFDSLNGGGKPVANTFRGPINEINKLKYFKFWRYAISNLEIMDFIDKENGDINNRSTVIKKTISTIKGYMELSKICLSAGIKSISLRQMNQDGLENFFGSVRSVCHNPNATIASLFRPGYTNLILNNLTSKHSISGNCEDDGNKSLLKNVCELYDDPALIMKDSKPEESNDDDGEMAIDLEVTKDELTELKFIENEVLISESGNACKSIITSTNCELCKCTIEAHCPLIQHRIIAATDSAIPILTYPTLLFMGRFKLLFKTVETLLPFICHEKNLCQKLLSSLTNVELEGIGCKEHKSEIASEMKKVTVKICLTNFIKQINGILSKKITERLPNQSVIYEKAFEILKKKKGIGKHGQKMIT